MFDSYGRVTGYGQMAPGRDVEELDTPGRPGRPRIGEAIGAAVPGPFKPPQATFRGAQQTIGAPPMNPSIDNLFGGPIQADAPDPREAAEPGGYAGPDAIRGRREPGGITGGQPVRDIHNQPSLAAPAIDFSQAGQFRNRMEGFDQSKFGKNDPKYVFEKYAEHFDLFSPQGREQFLQALKADPSGFFKNASIDGDILHGAYDPDSGRYGDVDFIRGFKAGGQGIQYGAIPFGDQQAAGIAAMGNPIQSAILGVPQAKSDVNADSYAARLRAQIMAALNANPQLAAIAQSSGLGF